MISRSSTKLKCAQPTLFPLQILMRVDLRVDFNSHERAGLIE